MNQRTYELFEQALKEFKQEHEYATYIVPDPIKEKFALLIVRECIEVVEQQKAKMSYGPTFVIEDIKQHFGVEE